MEKFKTNAKKASQEINKMSKETHSIPTPWNHLESKMNAIILETTLQEVSLYWDIKTYLRPGYMSTGDVISVPVIFTKISGEDTEVNNIVNELKLSPNTGIIESEDQLLDSQPFDGDMTTIDDKWIKTFVFKEFSYLNQNFQEKVGVALIELLENKDDYFTENITGLEAEHLIKVISRIKTTILQKYNNTDFQYTTPKVIIRIEGEQLSLDASIASFFLVMLGFDVVIINVDGFADIENYIQKEMINVFVRQKSKVKPVKKKKHLKIILAGVACTMLLGFTSLGIMNRTPDKDDMVEENSIVEVEETKKEAVVEVEETKNEEKVTFTDKENIVLNNDKTDFVANPDYNGFTFYEGELFRLISTQPSIAPDSITRVQRFNANPSSHEQMNNIDYTRFYDDLNRDIIDVGFWMYQSDSRELYNAKEDTYYILNSAKQIIVDGTKELMEINVGNQITVDLHHNKLRTEDYIVATIRDEFGNRVIPYKKIAPDYHEVFLEFIFEDGNGFEQIVEIDQNLGISSLPDGNYKVKIAETGVAAVNKFNLVSDEYIIKNGVIMKDNPDNKAPEVLADEIVIECELGDLLLINLEEIFKDDDILYIYEESDEFYFTESGVVGPYYAIAINNYTKTTLVLHASDGKSNTVEKIIKIIF